MPKGVIDLEFARAKIECKADILVGPLNESKSEEVWHETHKNMRVCIGLVVEKKRKHIYYYSENLNEMKALKAYVHIQGDHTLRINLMRLGAKASTVFNVTRFHAC